MRSRRRRGTRWLEYAAAIGTGLFAPVGVALFGCRTLLLRRAGPVRDWLLLWLLSLIPLALINLAGDNRTVATAWFLQAVLGIAVGWSAWAQPKALRNGLVVGLGVQLTLLVIVQLNAGTLWNTGATSDAALALGHLWFFGNEIVDREGARSWTVPQGTSRVSFHVDAKTLEAGNAWDWKSNGPVEISPAPSLGHGASIIRFGDSGDPYAQRWFDLGAPVGGNSFRVALDVRAERPIAALGCRGVWLQVWGMGGGAKCDALAVGPEWRRYELQWEAPKAAASHIIRVVLNDFDGHTIDVRDVHLYQEVGSAWHDVGPLAPSVPRITMRWAGPHGLTSRTIMVQQNREWNPIVVPIVSSTNAGRSPGEADSVDVTLIPSPGSRLATRNAIVLANGVPATPRTPAIRQSLWFGQPNLAGHTIASVGLAAVVLPGSLPSTLLILVMSITGVLLTGSRTALLAIVIGGALIVLARHERHRVWLGPSIAILTLVTAALVTSSLLPGQKELHWLTFNDGQTTPRTSIWRAAGEAFIQHPLTGLVGARESFTTYWHASPQNTTGEAVQHAHDLWLQFAAMYGIFGLLASLWMTVALMWMGSRRGGGTGTVFVGTILFMNVLDYTLMYTGVFVPLILGLNALSAMATPVRLGEGSEQASSTEMAHRDKAY